MHTSLIALPFIKSNTDAWASAKQCSFHTLSFQNSTSNTCTPKYCQIPGPSNCLFLAIDADIA